MKKKMHKILGVALTLVLMVSLTAGMAVPASADPGENEWDKMVFPYPGKLGDWFRDPGITGVGPIAEAIDGSFFAYVAGTGVVGLYKSEDEGRTWTPTKYATAAETTDGNIPVIVDIVPSSEDADIVYVASAGVNETTDVAPAVWKSTDIFSARAWKKLAEDSLVGLLTDGGTSWTAAGTDEEITSLDVGYIDGSPFVFVGSEDPSGAYDGGVYYLNEAAYGAGWTDLEIDIGTDATGIDVLRVACAPGFPDSSWIMAVAAKTSNTYVTNNTGTPGTWFDDVELKYGTGPTSLVSTAASRICFPSDFDAVTDYELFVGVSSSTATGAGDVYRVLSTTAYDCNVDDLAANDGFVSLDLIGPLGGTYLIAGEEDAAQAYYSSDDGVTWKGARKTPSGGGPTYVLIADDYDETSEAWAATATAAQSGGGFSRTINGGDTWDQISLIDTTLTTVAGIAFATASDIRFMATTSAAPTNDCLWRYDGTYWERIENRATGVIESVQCSPEYESDTTVFFADMSAGDIWRSTNGGGRFLQLANDPGAALKGWLVIDSRTLIGTTAGDTFKTKNYGRTVWSSGIGDYDLISFALSPAYEDDETILAGNDGGEVFKSTNAGEKWSGVLAGTFDGTGDTYVAFHPDYADNDTFFAASVLATDLIVQRYVDEWVQIYTGAAATSGATGIACSADGTLYVTDGAEEGVFRTVAPLAPIEAYCEWEQVTKDIAVNLNSLAVTYGSNILWGIEGDDVWTYEDTLAVPVELTSPASGSSSGRQTSCAVSWEALSGAKKYQVRCNTREDFKGAMVFDVADVEVPADVITALSSGGTYYWKVRVAAGQPTLSKWSEVWSFTTAHGAAQWNPFRGAVNEYPYMGATNVPLRPTFAWNAADWATAYEFELSTGSGTTAGGFFVDALVAMTGANALVNTVWQCDRDLDYSSTYYWHVRAISATSQSEWATGVFTTMAKPVEVVPPPPPVEIPPAPAPITPAWIWAIVIIGAVLVIAVIVLIVTTRRVP